MSFQGFSIKCSKFMEKEIDFYDFKTKKYLENFLEKNFEITQMLTIDKSYGKYFTQNKHLNEKILSLIDKNIDKVIIGITCRGDNEKELNIIFNFHYNLLELDDLCEFLKNNDIVIISSKIWSWGKTFETKFINILSNRLEYIKLSQDVNFYYFKDIEADKSESSEDEGFDEPVNDSDAVQQIMRNIVENQKAMAQTHMNQMNILMNLMSKMNQ